MPRINLLPSEYRRRRAERRTLSVVTIALVAFIGFLLLLWVVQRGSVGREQDRLRDEQAATSRLRAEVARLQQFQQVQQDATARQGVLAAALSNDVAWSKFLNDLSLIMPDNSWLTNMSLSSAATGTAPNGQRSFGSVNFQGFVFDFPGLAGWLTRISQMDGLTFVYLSSGSKNQIGTRPVVSFGANAQITQGLLSQRCQGTKPCP